MNHVSSFYSIVRTFLLVLSNELLEYSSTTVVILFAKYLPRTRLIISTLFISSLPERMLSHMPNISSTFRCVLVDLVTLGENQTTHLSIPTRPPVPLFLLLACQYRTEAAIPPSSQCCRHHHHHHRRR